MFLGLRTSSCRFQFLEACRVSALVNGGSPLSSTASLSALSLSLSSPQSLWATESSPHNTRAYVWTRLKSFNLVEVTLSHWSEPFVCGQLQNTAAYPSPPWVISSSQAASEHSIILVVSSPNSFFDTARKIVVVCLLYSVHNCNIMFTWNFGLV
jgi:hypothetical protein